MNKIERIIEIIFEKKKTKLDKLIDNCKHANNLGGYEAVKELCRNTKGTKSAAIYMFINTVLMGN